MITKYLVSKLDTLFEKQDESGIAAGRKRSQKIADAFWEMGRKGKELEIAQQYCDSEEIRRIG